MATEAWSNFDGALQEKLPACEKILRGLGRVVVAFSGGVDSTLLLALAVKTLGRENVIAAMGISASVPRRERRAGRRIAEQLGVELVEIETAELADPRYAANPSDRCFTARANFSSG
ncbi:MAG: asparagine synthase-related protein [Planctomycetota bacterium]|jgi:uncharacterized protein